MDAELFNLYVEKLMVEVTELTKTKLILAAQLEHQQKISATLNEKVKSLEEALDKAKSKKKDTSEF